MIDKINLTQCNKLIAEKDDISIKNNFQFQSQILVNMKDESRSQISSTYLN